MIRIRKWIKFLPFVLADYNMTPHSVTKFAPFELFNGGRPVLVINSTADPVTSEVKHFTVEECESILKVKRDNFAKLQLLAADRLILNAERMQEKFTKNKPSSKFACMKIN